MSRTKLLKAIEKGDRGAVKTLLAKGTSASLGEQPQGPARSSYDGGVPLVWALKRGHLDIAELLLQAGADPHERQGSVSPLQVAFESSKLADRRAGIDLLRQYGASLDSQQSNDSTLLGQYAEEGDIEKVQLLLEMGASVAPKGIPVQPFQKACEGRRADLCDLFLDRGVSPLAGNEGAEEVLSRAIYGQLDAVAERLLAMGASPAAGGENGPPIRYAVMTGSLRWVTRLLELGASLGWRSEDGEDLLTVAVQCGHESIACFLLDKGLKPTVETLKSPVVNGHFGLARALLARLQLAPDAALNLMNRAVAQHHLEIAALLLPHVPDLNVFGVDAWGTPWEGKYRGGLSPLFTAVVAGQLDFAKTLVARGASTELTLPRDAQSDRYSELKLPAGATLLKAADLARAFAAKEHLDLKPYEAVKEWLSKQPGGNQAIVATKASTSKKGAAEKPKTAASKGRKKGWREAIDDELLALGEHVGADQDALREALASVVVKKSTSQWMYLEAAVKRVRELLLTQRTQQALKGTLLLRLLEDRRHDGDEAVVVEEDEEVDGVNPIYLKHYPRAARKGLELGHIIASSDADVWYATREQDGTTKVFHAHPESHGLLGESLPDWIAKSRALD